MFSTKTIISTFPTIILIPRPITAVLPHVIILPLITFADFVASAVKLFCPRAVSGGYRWKRRCSDLQHVHAELSRLNIANWAVIVL